MTNEKHPPAPKTDFAADLKQHMTNDDFSTLLKRFNESSCANDSYAVATWMYSRFPEESKKLLPMVHSEEVCFDGKTNTNAGWAAALTAAKWLNEQTTKDKTPITLDTVTEIQVDKYAHQIYEENHYKPDGTPEQPRTCSLPRR